jgi:transmembrane sensor
MSDVVRLKTQTQIDNEAAVWTWRLDCGALTDAERSELETWLRLDGRHRRALEELRRTWSALDRLRERMPAQPLPASAPPVRRRLPLPRYWAGAAAAVLVMALATALWLAPHPATQVLTTAVGQQRHVTLADGSRLTLNTNTLLAVSFTRDRRIVDLRRGEAHFEVTHDAARPFLVHAGTALIRDLGTQFEVRVHPDHDVDVLVNEGRVEVQGEGSGPAREGGRTAGPAPGLGSGWVRALSAGEQLRIAGPNLEVMTVTPHQIDDELAWREGALVFEGEPLSQAITEVERYTHARIVLAGPQVGALRVSGRFRTDDVPGFFQALQEALPVRVSRTDAGLVTITPR